jgi:alpha-1,2-mannosyltransferase
MTDTLLLASSLVIIDSLWGNAGRSHILYPPCDTKSLERLSYSPRLPIILSLSQFRPEKNHALQISAFTLFLKSNPSFKVSARAVHFFLLLT